MELTFEKIREMVEVFVRVGRRNISEDYLESLRRGSIALKRHEDGWEINFVPYRTKKKGEYVAWVDLPDDIFEKDPEEFWISVAIIAASRFAASKAIINANLSRSPETRKRLSEIAYKAKQKVD